MHELLTHMTGSTSDGDLFLTPDEGFNRYMHVSITFYTDSTYTTPVTPTAGVTIITASEDNFNYGTIPNGTLDITAPDYDRPAVTGHITSYCVNMSGVVGASHYKLRVAHYE